MTLPHNDDTQVHVAEGPLAERGIAHPGDRRIQRREFRDYQPLFMLVNSLDFIDGATRRQFMCIHGPVWQRYNETTRRASERRITALFLSDENNCFLELLFVGCDARKGREHRCRAMWSHPAWSLDEAMARHACITLAGRSVLRESALWPVERTRHDFRPAGAERTAVAQAA